MPSRPEIAGWFAPRPVEPPILLVVIDTEEEFDWSAGFNRRHTAVGHLRGIDLLQRVFDEFGVRPVYVVDYPVAAQPEAALPLRAIAESGRAEIGAHLHPWVSPPYDEAVSSCNSYPGNLPLELERQKLSVLTDAIENGIGVRPRVYKAGRYGFGPHTAEILTALQYEVDLSPAPPFDLGDDGGPDYSAHGTSTRWLDPEHGLLSVPVTGAYVGFVQRGAHRIYQLATHPRLRWAHLPGVMARAGAIDRLRLSPEGYLPAEHRQLTRFLLRRGERIFTWSLHSTSIKPGCTPYVRTQDDLTRLLDSCRRFLAFFLGEVGGKSMTALELKRWLRSLDAEAVADVAGK